MNRVEAAVDKVDVRNVLVSVSDKRGLDRLVAGLLHLPGTTIYSTGGTYDRIRTLVADDATGLTTQSGRVRRVSDYTGQPEMQGGLVKTLDYKIYLGLLSEPFNEEHDRDRARVGAELIDMVVVNLYPFSSVVRRSGSDFEDARGNVDIGGPCMLRAAAKSFLRVAAVCDPSDYEILIEELQESGGKLGLVTRFRLAQKAFGHTAQYDRAIAEHLSGLDVGSVQSTYQLREGSG